MNTQAQAVDAVMALLPQQPVAIETDPVDFVEFLLPMVRTRDLDSIADDIVCFVVQWDDLVKHVRERLDVQRAYIERDYFPPAADQRRAAENIVTALRVLIQSRLTRGELLPRRSGL